MKAALALAAWLALGTPAQAAVSPVENAQVVITPAAATIPSDEPNGAIPEAAYFRAPQTPSNADRLFPCRVQFDLFEKKQLAQLCH